MKKNLFVVLLGLIALAVVVGAIGCGSGEQQTAEPNSNESKMAAKGACSKPWGDRPGKVKEEIVKEMSEKLRKQHEDRAFEIKPEREYDYIVLYVEGEIFGTDELKNFANKLNDFGDDGCVKKVVFVPKGSFAKGTYRTDPGFEWTTCPYPSQPCPTGECGCNKNGNSNTSKSDGSGSNSTNANSNSKANERVSNSTP